MPLILQNVQTAPIPTEAELNRWATIAIEDQTPDTVLLRITDTTESCSLNQRYRGKNSPTNVLSFPYPALPGLPQDQLGDLVICAPVVIAEAAAQQKPLHTHWAHLVIHGILHLRGYDHQTDAEALVMETREQQMLQQLGYPDPYSANTKENTTT